jgi:5'-3' exonuclease
MIVHLLDGTYELFRHFYGLRRVKGQADPPLGAVAGVLGTVIQMLGEGATHIGVATDHVIESFRNDLYDGYKTGDGIDPVLWSQFHPLEEALAAMGVATWPMVDLEADDGLASAAHLASLDERVEKICIWTPDKDLAQCVVGDRIVQVDRRSGQVRNSDAIRTKYGVSPSHIADYLALVGDTADGYPGIDGIGTKTAASLVNRYGHIEQFPPDVLGSNREPALLYKTLATLRTDAPMFANVDALRWTGSLPAFTGWAERIGDARLLTRVRDLEAKRAAGSAHGVATPPPMEARP